MNIYLRYFDKEVLVHNADEAIAFLYSISEIDMTPMLESDVREYIASDVVYPKRYKVRPRIYFILIKTQAASMQDFKEKKAVRALTSNGGEKGKNNNSSVISHLSEEKPGWYEGVMDFKRVTTIPGTSKFQYCDTHFVARCKATSGMDCYNRIIEHLRSRVDERSQFPSAKGKNFKFTFLGLAK